VIFSGSLFFCFVLCPYKYNAGFFLAGKLNDDNRRIFINAEHTLKVYPPTTICHNYGGGIQLE
jgi:hypothetical protein